MIQKGEIIQNLEKIRKTTPLIHNITNYVVMNNTANALLAIGASPIMAHAVEEVEDIVSLANAVVINIGTLSNQWVEAMKIAIQKTHQTGIPFILDPVGAGATQYRTQTSLDLIEVGTPAIIRGNASEIMALRRSDIKTRGVESSESSDSAVDVAKQLATEKKCVISISGETDYVTNGSEVINISNGVAMMSRITGTGCIATAITAACAAVNRDYFKAAASAMYIMGVAGEMAAQKASAPGSFQQYFMDALYEINASHLNDFIKA